MTSIKFAHVLTNTFRAKRKQFHLIIHERIKVVRIIVFIIINEYLLTKDNSTVISYLQCTYIYHKNSCEYFHKDI